MSSHHFVTAAQSTALLVCGAEIRGDILDALLEWNPLVICHAGVADMLIARDVRMDVIVCDGPETAAGLPYAAATWREDELGDRLTALFREGLAENLAIAGCTDRETDRWLHLYGGRPDVPVVAYSGRSRIIPVRPGREFRKWVPKGHRFCVTPRDGASILGSVSAGAEDPEMQVAMADGWIRIMASTQVKFREFL